MGRENVRISGAFDLDIGELMPTEGAYRVSEYRGMVRPYDGVVTLDSPSRGTSSPRGRQGRWRFGTATCSPATLMVSNRC